MRSLVLSMVLAAAVGCGSDTPDLPPEHEQVRMNLKNVGEFYRDFVAGAKKSSLRPADLEPLDVYYPAAGGAVKTGAIVVSTGGAVGSDPGTILAYAKDVPTSGGPVLMQDGVVKEMTVAEFTAAKKAGK